MSIASDPLCKETGLTPISERHSEDIFIIGYPKSGNTWLQSLVAAVVYGVTARHAPDELVQELIPDVYLRKYYRRYATPTYFRSHSLPMPDLKKLVYVIRDGRDVMVSYRHFLDALDIAPVGFLEMVRDGANLFPCKWHEHVEAWIRNPFGAEILIVRYEDLHRNPMAEMRRFCEFAGIERRVADLEEMIQASSFKVMRRREEKIGWANKSWPADAFFLRRGKVGSYCDEMPADVLAVFLAEAAPTLRRCGYEV